MSIADLFENGIQKQHQGHFRNLVLIAKADGELADSEAQLLKKIGAQLGLTESNIQAIRAQPENYPVIPPVSYRERFEQMVNLIQMVQADGRVAPSEIGLLEKIAMGIGYKGLDEVDVDRILKLIKDGETTESIVKQLA